MLCKIKYSLRTPASLAVTARPGAVPGARGRCSAGPAAGQEEEEEEEEEEEGARARAPCPRVGSRSLGLVPVGQPGSATASPREGASPWSPSTLVPQRWVRRRWQQPPVPAPSESPGLPWQWLCLVPALRHTAAPRLAVASGRGDDGLLLSSTLWAVFAVDAAVSLGSLWSPWSEGAGGWPRLSRAVWLRCLRDRVTSGHCVRT